jgi:hypothetical protein
MTAKKNVNQTSELVWDHAPHEVAQSGLSRKRVAAPDELARIARALDLLACSSLAADYTITPGSLGRYHVSGMLRAEIEQSCVVTLEPVASVVEERFDVTFWPEAEMPAPAGGALDMDEEPDPEPMLGGQIGVGRVVFECLAAAVDPFPRQPDAALDVAAAPPEGAAGRAQSPFAVLANVKAKG